MQQESQVGSTLLVRQESQQQDPTSPEKTSSKVLTAPPRKDW